MKCGDELREREVERAPFPPFFFHSPLMAVTFIPPTRTHSPLPSLSLSLSLSSPRQSYVNLRSEEKIKGRRGNIFTMSALLSLLLSLFHLRILVSFATAENALSITHVQNHTLYQNLILFAPQR
jgi:hypothetical protein